MAPPAGTLRVGRYFLVLALLFILLYAIVLWPGTDHAPKLGLDLRGGAQIIYKAQTTDGKTPSSDSMNQAKSIIDQRVNGLGVEQSTVVIQGGDEIVVTVPGKRADQLADVGKTALLDFRPLISGGYAVTAAAATATPTASGSATSTASGSTTPSAGASSSAANSASSAPTSGASGQDFEAKPLAADTTPATSPAASATPSASTSPSAGTTASPSASASPSATSSADSLDTTALGYSALTDAQKTEITNFNCENPKEDANHDIVVCDTGHTTKYLLGPILVPGYRGQLSAVRQAPNATSGQFQWTVNISLKAGGQKTWSEYTSAHHNPNPNDTTTSDPTPPTTWRSPSTTR